jgi:hypothetical protein
MEILDAVTVFELPTVLEENVGVPLTVKMSPDTRLSAYTTDAVVDPSYTLLLAVIVTFKDRDVMFAVAVAVVFCV